MIKIELIRIARGEDMDVLLGQLDLAMEEIRQRAYLIFEQRGCRQGDAVGDWLEAERELTFQVESDLVQTETDFQLSVRTPDAVIDTLRIATLSTAMIIHGKGNDSGIEKLLWRRIDLPETVDVDTSTVNLDNGILRVVALKSAAAGEETRKKTAGRAEATLAKSAAA